ncbi:hypothetical protein SLA_0723 [Streptomyces laurentii]|uniref:Uncharacterized protein n=1 Tax=Streptomyces laurentii TaxID=39478 RepID=A0A160NT96_STRLU|nr:hypothetical protein SLA_0723 [Streptomyces laurentii]
MAPDAGLGLAAGAEVDAFGDDLAEFLAHAPQQRGGVAADVEALLGLVGFLGGVHEEAVDLRHGLDGGEVRVEGGFDARAPVGGGVEGGAQGGEEGVGVAGGEGAVEAALVAEVAVEDRFGDPGFGGDGVHGGLGAVAEHHAVRRLQQFPAPLVGGLLLVGGGPVSGVHGRVSPPVRIPAAVAT